MAFGAARLLPCPRAHGQHDSWNRPGSAVAPQCVDEGAAVKRPREEEPCDDDVDPRGKPKRVDGLPYACVAFIARRV